MIKRAELGEDAGEAGNPIDLLARRSSLPPGADAALEGAVLTGVESPSIESPSVLNELQGTLDSVPALRLPGEENEALALRPRDPARRYQLDSVIGKGGMGTVLKAFDGDLRRWVAMKVVRQEALRNKEYLSRFVEEAQVCGQLEHPNIPPVHELGVDQNGQVYFTMKLVKGRTLQEIARDLSLGRPEVRREFTPIRLAQVLQQAAMGVHYANVRGVIHRDLKPENIMVGDYGEVLVMDWGLAKVSGEDQCARLFGEDSVVTARTESGLHTVVGAVQGTPSYMSPEQQARGEQGEIDARTDVYGLGAVLYTLLCYQPPSGGRTVQEVLAAARAGSPPPPSRVAPRRTEVPPDLEAICMKALQSDRASRYPDARAFQEDLQGYIEGIRDGERRRARALALVAEGRKEFGLYQELERRGERLRKDAQEAAARTDPHEPVEGKKPLWAIEDSVQRLLDEAARSFSRARAILDTAIQTDPRCREARRALADLYWGRFRDAEAERDTHAAAVYRGLVEANDDGPYTARLKGDGAIGIESDPPGAEAILYSFREEDRVLRARDPRSLGRTPLGPLPFPMGSYLVVLKREGHPDTRYPIFIDRSETHAGRVKLLPEARIGEGFIHVPGGEFIRGGDPGSDGGFARSRVWVDDFLIARFQVTMGEYCEFLDALAARGEDPKPHIPRQGGEVCVELGPGGGYRPSAILVVGETRKRYPHGFETACPALALTWASACAFARWRSGRDGREYDLPPEDAWEKAARGVDGRFHPWGDRFDWTFSKGGLSRPERAQPEPVGTFPTDESPYGVRDTAGTIREWTQSWFNERAGMRATRGGSWNLVVPGLFRCATRVGYAAGIGSSTVGFRLFAWVRG